MRPPRDRTRRIFVIGLACLLLIGAAAMYQMMIGNAVTAASGVTLTGWATDATPLVGGVGTIRNDGPFDVQIVGIRSVGARAGVSLTAEGDAPGSPFRAGDQYTLRAHDEVYVWFSLTTEDGAPTGFTKIEVDYAGPLGLLYTASGTAVGMLAYPSDLPVGVAALDDSDEAFGEYLQALFDAGAASDPQRMALVLGNSASEDDAADFMADHPGLSDAMGYQSERNGTTTTISFFRESSADSLPAFDIEWSHHRWQVVP